ncbi:hypothetical protein CYMTET_54367 [Cymbomonas tetramitiformis]|uniref:Uncharacterized protein n=1 Tax=Cymbomonas tetramitiformis TaxID=36881 RepID=A0AAE0EPN2_9CHLO|nr:hypothetical protein CYMTET_54367 [Cymbomonas tetramitiformis]
MGCGASTNKPPAAGGADSSAAPADHTDELKLLEAPSDPKETIVKLPEAPDVSPLLALEAPPPASDGKLLGLSWGYGAKDEEAAKPSDPDGITPLKEVGKLMHTLTTNFTSMLFDGEEEAEEEEEALREDSPRYPWAAGARSGEDSAREFQDKSKSLCTVDDVLALRSQQTQTASSEHSALKEALGGSVGGGGLNVEAIPEAILERWRQDNIPEVNGEDIHAEEFENELDELVEQLMMEEEQNCQLVDSWIGAQPPPPEKGVVDPLEEVPAEGTKALLEKNSRWRVLRTLRRVADLGNNVKKEELKLAAQDGSLLEDWAQPLLNQLFPTASVLLYRTLQRGNDGDRTTRLLQVRSYSEANKSEEPVLVRLARKGYIMERRECNEHANRVFSAYVPSLLAGPAYIDVDLDVVTKEAGTPPDAPVKRVTRRKASLADKEVFGASVLNMPGACWMLSTLSEAEALGTLFTLKELYAWYSDLCNKESGVSCPVTVTLDEAITYICGKGGLLYRATLHGLHDDEASEEEEDLFGLCNTAACLRRELLVEELDDLPSESMFRANPGLWEDTCTVFQELLETIQSKGPDICEGWGTPVGWTHGALHAGNIFVDRLGGPWVINLAPESIVKQHFLNDLAGLEASLLFECTPLPVSLEDVARGPEDPLALSLWLGVPVKVAEGVHAFCKAIADQDAESIKEGHAPITPRNLDLRWKEYLRAHVGRHAERVQLMKMLTPSPGKARSRLDLAFRLTDMLTEKVNLRDLPSKDSELVKKLPSQMAYTFGAVYRIRLCMIEFLNEKARPSRFLGEVEETSMGAHALGHWLLLLNYTMQTMRRLVCSPAQKQWALYTAHRLAELVQGVLREEKKEAKDNLEHTNKRRRNKSNQLMPAGSYKPHDRQRSPVVLEAGARIQVFQKPKWVNVTVDEYSAGIGLHKFGPRDDIGYENLERQPWRPCSRWPILDEGTAGFGFPLHVVEELPTMSEAVQAPKEMMQALFARQKEHCHALYRATPDGAYAGCQVHLRTIKGRRFKTLLSTLKPGMLTMAMYLDTLYVGECEVEVVAPVKDVPPPPGQGSGAEGEEAEGAGQRRGRSTRRRSRRPRNMSQLHKRALSPAMSDDGGHDFRVGENAEEDEDDDAEDEEEVPASSSDDSEDEAYEMLHLKLRGVGGGATSPLQEPPADSPREPPNDAHSAVLVPLEGDLRPAWLDGAQRWNIVGLDGQINVTLKAYGPLFNYRAGQRLIHKPDSGIHATRNCTVIDFDTHTGMYVIRNDGERELEPLRPTFLNHAVIPAYSYSPGQQLVLNTGDTWQDVELVEGATPQNRFQVKAKVTFAEVGALWYNRTVCADLNEYNHSVCLIGKNQYAFCRQLYRRTAVKDFGLVPDQLTGMMMKISDNVVNAREVDLHAVRSMWQEAAVKNQENQSATASLAPHDGAISAEGVHVSVADAGPPFDLEAFFAPSRWRHHGAHDHPMWLMVGDFATGKSSLLRQIHVECSQNLHTEFDTLLVDMVRMDQAFQVMRKQLATRQLDDLSQRISMVTTPDIGDEHRVHTETPMTAQELEDLQNVESDLVDSPDPLDVYLRFAQHGKDPYEVTFLQQAARTKRLVILVDGVDQVKKYRPLFLQFVLNGLTKSGHRLMITTRSLGFDLSLIEKQQLRYFSMVPPTHTQIRQTVDNRITASARQKFLKRVEPFSGLLRNPMMVSLLISIFQIDLNLPRNMAQLYTVAVRIMLARCSELNGETPATEDDVSPAGAGPSSIEYTLQELAYRHSLAESVNIAEASAAPTPRAGSALTPRRTRVNETIARLMQRVVAGTFPILRLVHINSAPDAIVTRFCHIHVQHYLTARWLIHLVKSHQQLPPLHELVVNRHLAEARDFAASLAEWFTDALTRFYLDKQGCLSLTGRACLTSFALQRFVVTMLAACSTLSQLRLNTSAKGIFTAEICGQLAEAVLSRPARAVPLTLCLNYCHVKSASCAALVPALKLQTGGVLVILDLSHNSIGPQGAAAIAGGLVFNSTLQTLLLADNQLAVNKHDHRMGEQGEGVAALSKALKVNSTVTRLSLRGNHIGPKGAALLAAGLAVNTGVHHVDLAENDFLPGPDPSGLVALANLFHPFQDAPPPMSAEEEKVMLLRREKQERQEDPNKVYNRTLKTLRVEHMELPVEHLRDCQEDTIRMRNMKLGPSDLVLLCTLLEGNTSLTALELPQNCLMGRFSSIESEHVFGINALVYLLRDCPNLTHLDLHACWISNQGCLALAAGLQHGGHFLWGIGKPTENDDLRETAVKVPVVSLDLSGNFLGEGSMKSFLTAIKVASVGTHLASLQKLLLHNACLGPAGMKAVASVLGTKLLNTVVELDLSKNGMGGAEHQLAASTALAEMLRANSVLKKLDISGNDWSAQDSHVIAEAVRSYNHLDPPCSLEELVMVKDILPLGQLFREEITELSFKRLTAVDAVVLGRCIMFTPCFDCFTINKLTLHLSPIRENEITHLDLSNTGFSEAHCIIVTSMLMGGNTSVQTLNLEGNCLAGRNREVEAEHPEGMRYLSDMLKAHKHIRTLKLSQNLIGPKTIMELVPGLIETVSVTTVDLSDNLLLGTNVSGFGEYSQLGFERLMAALKPSIGNAHPYNRSITDLNLSENNLQARGGALVAEVVAPNEEGNYNDVLKVLNVADNKLGPKGIGPIAQAFRANKKQHVNQSLTTLILSNNNFTNFGEDLAGITTLGFCIRPKVQWGGALGALRKGRRSKAGGLSIAAIAAAAAKEAGVAGAGTNQVLAQLSKNTGHPRISQGPRLSTTSEAKDAGVADTSTNQDPAQLSKNTSPPRISQGPRLSTTSDVSDSDQPTARTLLSQVNATRGQDTARSGQDTNRSARISEASGQGTNRVAHVSNTSEATPSPKRTSRMSRLSGVEKKTNGLVALQLFSNNIGIEGAQILIDAFEQSTMQTMCGIEPFTTSLELAKRSLHTDDVMLVASDLYYNQTITSVDLSANGVCEMGLRALAHCLASEPERAGGRCNSSVAVMLLADNKTSGRYGSHEEEFPIGFEALGWALRENTTVNRFDLSRNGIGPKCIRALISGLNVNTTIRVLDLTGNHLGPEGLALLAKELLEPNVGGLHVLTLDDNSVAGRSHHSEPEDVTGMKALGRALKFNTHLKEVHLSQNALGKGSTMVLSEGLSQNEGLREIDLSRNHLGFHGALAIADALLPKSIGYCNSNIRSVNLHNNHILTEEPQESGMGNAQGVTAWADVLYKRRSGILEVILSDNRLEVQGAMAICDVLLKLNEDMAKQAHGHIERWSPFGGKISARIVLYIDGFFVILSHRGSAIRFASSCCIP